MFFHFPAKLINLKMSSITSSSIEVLINGRKTNAFLPSRGIRQGDPMSPYLFILCLERLFRNIEEAVTQKKWTSIKISRSGPNLSHLFFKDDLTLSARADPTNCTTISNILLDFRNQSGLRVNLSKSSTLFSGNYSTRLREKCSNILGMEEKTIFGKYLSLIFQKRLTNSDLGKKLTNWKSNTLSMADKHAIAKSSLSSVPSHVMSYIRIPKRITKTIDKIIRDFIWGSTGEKRKMHLINWKTVTKSKKP